MPVIVGEPDATVLSMLADVMRRYHKPLHDAQVRVGVIMLADADNGPAIVSKGHSILARIKVCNLKERLKKKYDAELEIDQTAFDRLPEASQIAMFDHELSHIALKRYDYVLAHDAAGNPDGEPQIECSTDDLHRPKLVSVPGDFQGSDCFAAVVERHGRHACESISARKFQKIINEAEEEWFANIGKEVIENTQTLFEERHHTPHQGRNV